MLQKSSIFRVLEVFFAEPTKPQYLMDISRRISLSHTSVKMNLMALVRMNIIEEDKERRGSRKFPIYKARKDSLAFIIQKRAHNLTSIMESGLISFIQDQLAPKSIVMFGSYQRGEDDETSDIDLFVECRKEELELKRFEGRLGRKVELHFAESFASYTKELKNNIINGVVVSGFLEAYK